MTPSLRLAGTARVPWAVLPVLGQAVGALNVHYFWDSAAKSSFEGGTFWVSFTIGKLAP